MEQKLLNLISAANTFGLNYIFINKGMIKEETIDGLKKYGFSVVIGQGEVSRIKITW